MGTLLFQMFFGVVVCFVFTLKPIFSNTNSNGIRFLLSLFTF